MELTVMVNPTDAVNALVGAEGNVNLAAERLDCSLDAFVDALTERPDDLAAKVRVLSLINLVKTQYWLHLRMHEAIADMEPYEVSKSYSNLLASITALTEPSVKKFLSVSEHISSGAVPARLRDALLTLGVRN